MWTQHKDFLFSFLNFDSLFSFTIQPPEKFANIWPTKQDGIRAIN